VTGLSWLDREWSSSALAADQQGWDWFALQLDDGSNLMFYNLRKADGSQDDYSAGTWMDIDGRTLHLDRDDVHLSVTDYWDSPAGGRYPAGWQLHVPGEELRLTVTPVVADQELFTTVRYWEGAVDVTAERSGVAVGGRGYVELTGYADQIPSRD
jgi:predicted secreted hydrolase